MRNESVTAVDSQPEIAERPDLTALRRSLSVSSGISPVNPATEAGLDRGFGARIKRMLANMTKALEGDHEFHNYLGG